MTIIGIKRNGEHLRFEYWAYAYYRRGCLNDDWLQQAFDSCVDFRAER